MSEEKLVFVIPTHNSFERYDTQRKLKGRRNTFRERTKRNVVNVLDALFSAIRSNSAHEPEIVVARARAYHRIKLTSPQKLALKIQESRPISK